METFTEIMFFITFITFFYFLIRGVLNLFKNSNDNKPYFKYSLVSLALSILFIIVGLAVEPQKTTTTKQDDTSNSKRISSTSKKEDSKKNSATNASHAVSSTNNSSKKASSKQKRTYDFSKIKLGMTKSEIVKLIGKPDSDMSGTLSYGNDYLMLNQKGKLFSGSPKTIKNQIDSNANKEKSSSSSKKESDEGQLQSFANTFGRKGVETLQKYVGSVYSATDTPNGMMYGYKTDYGMLYRVDNTASGITKVYSDDNGHLGKELYVGQTIKQKPKVYYYNN